jgi:hypothetical protein
VVFRCVDAASIDVPSNCDTVQVAKDTIIKPSSPNTTAVLKLDATERFSSSAHQFRQNSRDGYGGSKGKSLIGSCSRPG